MKVSSTTDSDYENLDTSKTPRLDSLSKQDTPQHQEIKRSSSSQSTKPTDNDQSFHSVKQIPIPSNQSTDDGVPLLRPQSPNTEQITERNQILGETKTQSIRKIIITRCSLAIKFSSHY